MNKSIEKYMYLLVEILIVAALAVFIYFNKNATVAFFCPIMQKMYVTKLIYLTLLIFVLSHTAGFALCAFFKTKVSALVDAYQKRHENISDGRLEGIEYPQTGKTFMIIFLPLYEKKEQQRYQYCIET